MTLAIFLNLRFYHDGSRYTADESYFMFWTTFTKYFSRVIFCVPVLETKDVRGKFQVDLLSGKIEICHLPFYRSSAGLYAAFPFYSRKVKKTVRDKIGGWDLVGAVVPHAFGQLFLRLAADGGKPSFAYVRGNIRKAVKFEYEKRRSLKPFANLLAWRLERKAKGLCKTRLTFVVGRELFDLYGGMKGRSVYEIYPGYTACGPIVAAGRREDPTRPFSKPDQRAIMFIGRLSREKGVSYLIDAMQILFKEDAGIGLNIVGSGVEEASLRAKVARQGLKGRINFLGYIPYGDKRIFRLYRETLAFVLPSVTEGFPKVILEAMTNRTPVIATAVGGIPAVIKDGFNGVLVSPANPEALAQAIRRLRGSSGLRAELVENGLETARRFSGGRQRDYIAGVFNSHFGFSLEKIPGVGGCLI